VIQKENIGKLSYISTYVPILNENGQTIGYINIPYFGQTQYLKENISRFIIALVNVYVPLLLITGLLGLFIANSLTKPLAEIGEKLRKVVLGKRNEPIIWKRDDEIGLLVKEYNKMIVKLEDSASNLAKSEREGAWREMAKQIAHEIKNPLTPMKLSIQYLQRAIQEESPDTRELTKRMSDTLIEQIDNLSEIATAFSSFAQMPNANNEVIDLEHYIQSIVDLFNDDQEIKINYRSEVKPASIFADKNQMISVFNNIIKNATQAKPDNARCLIDILISEENDSIKVVIKDNGNGIPDEIKEKVFVPNFTTKNSGSGLGLAISKQIIENANGHIWFDSTVGVGTIFYVSIPKYHHPTNH
jgi:nitrogen fixation/metabolism regulation signal transduction histidine kinase